MNDIRQLKQSVPPSRGILQYLDTILGGFLQSIAVGRSKLERVADLCESWKSSMYKQCFGGIQFMPWKESLVAGIFYLGYFSLDISCILQHNQDMTQSS